MYVVSVLKLLLICSMTATMQVSPSEIRITWQMPLSILEAPRTQEKTKPKIEWKIYPHRLKKS